MKSTETLENKLLRALEHIDRLEKRNIELEKALSRVMAEVLGTMSGGGK